MKFSGVITSEIVLLMPRRRYWGLSIFGKPDNIFFQNVYAVDLSKLNAVAADDTPRLSAKQLDNASNGTSPTKSKGTSRRSSSFEQTSLFIKKRDDVPENPDENPIKMIDEE